MLVFTEQPVMFIHIQKTGGTWVREVLEHIGIPNKKVTDRHHLSIEKAREVCPNHLAFTIIRNPFSWYQSYWAMKMIRSKNTRAWNQTGLWTINRCVATDFNQFIRNVLTICPRYYSSILDYSIDLDTLVLKQEQLVEDFIELLHYLGESFDENKVRDYPKAEVNASLPEYIQKVKYTEENAEKILETEKYVFENYEYMQDYEDFV